MKKQITLLLLLNVSMFSFAQIQPVAYRGAFAPAPTEMWTDGWVNWDPQTTVYPDPTVTVSGTISVNTTWTSNNVYQLSGLVYVDSLITLTIQPGTIIRGGTSNSNASLVIKRGGKLMAEGMPNNPIVFTSGLAPTDRNVGNWGGIIILGRALNNFPGGVGFIEGLTVNSSSAHGGTDNSDNSGMLKYVRIEFGGFRFATNNEINALTMGSVGSGTEIDYIQTSFTNDDAFEWFGGSVNCSHLVSYRNLDDDFDTDNGFSGKVQFCLSVRDPDIADDPAISFAEGFESDNNSGGNTNTPQTSAVFSNVTVIGPYRGDAAASVEPGFERGARLRRNTALKIFNSIFMDYAKGLFIDGSSAKLNAFNGVLKYKNNLVALTTPAHRVAEDDSTRLIFFMAANSNDSLSTTAGILVTPYNYTSPDYRPVPVTSPALTNFDFSDAVLPITLISFTGDNVKSDNFLYWETSTEINNTGFEIQRSLNGQSYTSLGFVPSPATDGNSTAKLKYTYADRNARSEKSYYRLKQIDKNGKSMLSNIVVLSRTIPDHLSLSIIYPNPVVKGNLLNVEIASPIPQTITVAVNDAFGRRLMQNKVQLLRGINNHQLNVQSISAGSYYVTISAANAKTKQVRKFIKH